MLRYENNGSLINIRLDKTRDIVINQKYNGYSVECVYIYDFDKDEYTLKFRLKCDTIPDIYPLKISEISDKEIIKSTKDQIKMDIANNIEEKLNNGFFDEHVAHFEFLLKCFEIGLDSIENESVTKIINE